MHATSNTPSPSLHAVVPRLHPGLSRGQHQRFFGRMQREMSQRGLLLNWSGDICLVVNRDCGDERTVRHTLVNWLIDRGGVREIFLFRPIHIMTVLCEPLTCELRAAEMRELVPEISSLILEQITAGLIARAISQLQVQAGSR